MERVSQIGPYQRMFSWSPLPQRNRQGNSGKRKSESGPARSFNKLSGMVEDTHQTLLKEDAPFRFCIYKDKEDVFMDVVAINKAENVKRVYSRSITYDRVPDLVRRIHSQMGLILDYSL